MTRRMPVLRQDDPAKVTHQAVHDRQDRIGIRHGKRTPTAEVGLDVDEHEGGSLHGQVAGRSDPAGVAPSYSGGNSFEPTIVRFMPS